MPPSPSRIVLLSEYAAGPPGVRSGYEPVGIQVRVRAEQEGIAEARSTIAAIKDAIHGVGGRDIGAFYVVQLTAQQAAFPVVFDQEQRRPEFVTNFIAVLSR